MQSLLNQFLTWADENNMQINCTKTKENILGSTSKRDWPSLSIHGTPLERVSIYKLLGVFISADLRGKHTLSISFLKLHHGYTS